MCPLLRFRQTQAQKSKKDSKLELFGFEDADTHQEENSSDPTDSRSSYKIKYFGFDDMSDSDGSDDNEDGGGSKQRRRRAKKAAVAKAIPVVTVEETPAYDPPDPFERLESREKPTARDNKKNSERQESRIREGEATPTLHLS